MQESHSAKPKNLTSEVVRAYRSKMGRRGKPISFVRFAQALNQYVNHLDIGISYQAVKNWEDGIYRPNFFFIQQLANHAAEGSWQRTFAMDVLAVQWPELYQPGSEIGKTLCEKEINLP